MVQGRRLEVFLPHSFPSSCTGPAENSADVCCAFARFPAATTHRCASSVLQMCPHMSSSSPSSQRYLWLASVSSVASDSMQPCFFLPLFTHAASRPSLSTYLFFAWLTHFQLVRQEVPCMTGACKRGRFKIAYHRTLFSAPSMGQKVPSSKHAQSPFRGCVQLRERSRGKGAISQKKKRQGSRPENFFFFFHADRQKE